MIYLDTSFILAIALNEREADQCLTWLATQETGALLTSDWTRTEAASAVGIKQRMGLISEEARTRALAGYASLIETALSIVEVPRSAFVLASDYLNDPACGLRGGDALHLAVVALGRHRLVTFDVKMRDAAIRLGIDVVAI